MGFKKKFSISVFFPCYNDEHTIGKLVEQAYKMLSKLTIIYEVIVIDDGSTDKSRQVLLGLKDRYPDLKLVFHKTNRGYGGALKSGFKEASKDLVFYTDGDGQYDIKELPNLYMLISDKIDFVNGIKESRQDALNRVIIGKLYNFTVRWLFWLPVFDVDCDFRLIKTSLVKKINLTVDSGAVCVELVKKADLLGARFAQVTVFHYPRIHGRSQFFKINRIAYTFFDLFKLWSNLIFKKRPRQRRINY